MNVWTYQWLEVVFEIFFKSSLCSLSVYVQFLKIKLYFYLPDNVLSNIKSISYLNYTLELTLEADTVPKQRVEGFVNSPWEKHLSHEKGQKQSIRRFDGTHLHFGLVFYLFFIFFKVISQVNREVNSGRYMSDQLLFHISELLLGKT